MGAMEWASVALAATSALLSLFVIVVLLLGAEQKFRASERDSMRTGRFTPMKTPVTNEGLHQYDDLDPCEAARKAWNEPGRRPEWHRRMQAEVRDKMPLLARALDRM